MVEIPVQRIDISGLAIAWTPAKAEGHQARNNGRIFLALHNTGAVVRQVTVSARTRCSHGYLHDVAIPVPAGMVVLAGPFSRDRWNDASGRMAWSYDATDGLEVAAVELSDLELLRGLQPRVLSHFAWPAQVVIVDNPWT